MFLKREVRRKDGKEHVYYCVAETTRVGRDRVVQRRLLNLGESNTTQIDRWQRSIEVIEEDGRACQRRLFSDREGRAPQQEEDVCESGALKPLSASTADIGRLLAGMPIVGGVRS